MAVPKKRTSSTKRNMRRSHALKSVNLIKTETGFRLPHTADPDTGQYRGRAVTKPKTSR